MTNVSNRVRLKILEKVFPPKRPPDYMVVIYDPATGEPVEGSKEPGPEIRTIVKLPKKGSNPPLHPHWPD